MSCLSSPFVTSARRVFRRISYGGLRYGLVLTAARPGGMLQQQERGRSLASDPMPLARSMNERSPTRASSHALVTKAAGMVRIRRRVAQRPICEFLL